MVNCVPNRLEKIAEIVAFSKKISILLVISSLVLLMLDYIELYPDIERYINKTGYSLELEIIEENINKLCRDIVCFFDIEKRVKGKNLYNSNVKINGFN